MLLLAWTRPAPNLLLTRDGGDPLGFRAYANRLARELCPGLTQSTRSTRCFSLLTLGVHIANKFEEAERNERFLRFERLWVAAQVARFGDKTTFSGKRRAGRIVESARQTGKLQLDVPILTAQLSMGIWGTYRRSAALFGLILAKGRGGPRHAKLTAKGRELADLLCQQVAPKVQFKTYLAKPAAPESLLDVIDPLGTGTQPSEEECSLLTERMERFDRRHEHALGRLRSCFDQQGGDLDLDELDAERLSPHQRPALQAARGLKRLLLEIEKPYRTWVTGASEEVDIDSSIWAHEAWDIARRRGEIEVTHLRDRITNRQQDPMAQLHAHHEWLTELRGGIVWKQGDEDPTKAAFTMPDFGLSAPAQLFAEGVNPSGPR